MKYDHKYPLRHYLYMDQPENGIILTGELESCWHCGNLTYWADMDFLASVCSEECRKAKWDEYTEDCRRKTG